MYDNLQCNNVPYALFKKLKTLAGKTDSIGIIILSDFLNKYSTENISEFSFDYFSLEEKFEYTRTQIRDAIVRLEEANLLKRIFDTTSDGHYLATEISIKLNIDNIQKLFENDSINFKQSDGLSDIKNNDQNQLKKNLIPPLEISKPRNTNKKKERSRSSSKSNFVKIEEKNLTVSDKIKDQNQNTATCKKPKTFFNKILDKFSLTKIPLKDFLPITQEKAEKLREMSGREFSCHFINKLAEKLGRKNAELKFYKEELFLQYMSKALKHEMRNPHEVNNTNFKFRASSEEEQQGEEINRYLEEVERSTSMTEEARLRRKIVGICEEKVAYSVLTGMSIEKKGNKLIINHNSHRELNKIQNDQLFQEARLIYGNQIESIEWKVKEKMQAQKDFVVDNISKSNEVTYKKNLLNEVINPNIEIENNQTLWGRVKAELIKSYGTATYISWFSKLNTEENIEKNLLTLKAPTEFIKRWIKNNYEKRIEQICQKLLIQVNCT